MHVARKSLAHSTNAAKNNGMFRHVIHTYIAPLCDCSLCRPISYRTESRSRGGCVRFNNRMKSECGGAMGEDRTKWRNRLNSEIACNLVYFLILFFFLFTFSFIGSRALACSRDRARVSFGGTRIHFSERGARYERIKKKSFFSSLFVAISFFGQFLLLFLILLKCSRVSFCIRCCMKVSSAQLALDPGNARNNGNLYAGSMVIVVFLSFSSFFFRAHFQPTKSLERVAYAYIIRSSNGQSRRCRLQRHKSVPVNAASK